MPLVCVTLGSGRKGVRMLNEMSCKNTWTLTEQGQEVFKFCL